MSRPPSSWRVSVGPEPAPLIAEVLHAQQIWSWLTRPQRTAIDQAVDGMVVGRPVVLRSLQRRGLVQDGRLSEVGQIVHRWRPCGCRLATEGHRTTCRRVGPNRSAKSPVTGPARQAVT